VQKQPHPSDHSTVIIYVVGGVSVADVRDVRQVVEEKGSMQNRQQHAINMLVGGTSLLSPHQLVDKLFHLR